MLRLDGRSLQAARALLDWSQQELAHKAQVSVGTVKNLEASKGPVHGRTDTVDKIVAALEKAGIEFFDNGEPGVRLRRPKRR